MRLIKGKKGEGIVFPERPVRRVLFWIHFIILARDEATVVSNKLGFQPQRGKGPAYVCSVHKYAAVE